MPFFFFSWEIKVNNSKVVEYSKGFLGITVNLPSDDWPLKFWPLNLYFNPIARDMAQNDAVFFYSFQSGAKKNKFVEDSVGFPELIVNLAVGRKPAEKLAPSFVIKAKILNRDLWH